MAQNQTKILPLPKSAIFNPIIKNLTTMASKAATKTVAKVAKVAKSTPKPKTAAPAKKAPATERKPFEAKENAGFKENTARELANKYPTKLTITSAHEVQNTIFTALRTNLAKTGRVAVPGLGVFKVGWV